MLAARRGRAAIAPLSLFATLSCSSDGAVSPPGNAVADKVAFSQWAINNYTTAVHVVDLKDSADSTIARSPCIGRVYAFKFGARGIASFGTGCPGIEINPRDGRPAYIVAGQFAPLGPGGARQVSYVVGTPDSSRLVFQAADEQRLDHVYVVNADGSGLRQIDQGAASTAFNPSLGASGRLVAFTQCESVGSCSIVVADLDAATTRRILVGTNSATPTLSADGRSILLIPVDSPNAIYRVAADGSGSVPELVLHATGDEVFNSVNWSPDGAGIIVEGGNVMVFATLNGSVQRRIAGGYFAGPSAISPDGTRITYAVTNGGIAEVYLANADGTNARAITNAGQRSVYPFWTR